MAVRLSGTILCALCLLCGCTTFTTIPAAFSQAGHRLPDETTVRSQDTSLPAPWKTPSLQRSDRNTEVHAGHSQLKAISSPGSQPMTAGHTFAQPKARLGRPILKAQTDVLDSNVGSSANAAPLLPESKLPDRPVDEGKAKSSVKRVSPSPWLSPQQSGWQSDPENSRSWTELNKSRSVNTPGAGIEEVKPATDQTSQALGKTVSPERPSAASAPNAAEPLPEVSREAPGGVDDVAPIVPEEPTMLARLRGLYSPRIDDNTDKLKRQIRRWPDPFGLLKDRDDAGVPVPADPQTTEPEDPERAGETAELPNGLQSQLQDPTHSIQTVIADVERQLTDWPRTPSGKPEQPEQWRQRQTDLRLLYMISGRSAEAIRVIESLPEAEQEFWQSLMLSMNRYRESSDSVTRPQQLTESLEHLRTAARRLQPLSLLSIRRLMLCDRIDGFGNVVGFPTANFEPGQRILVYAELQNFQSELTTESKYRSEFAAVIEFMREGDDEVVETLRVPKMEDLCDAERTDYFHSYELTLPALEGKYLMRIRLRDQLSLQTAESQLEFTIRSRGTGL